MRFLLFTLALVMSIATIAAGILWATGNMHIPTDIARDSVERAKQWTSEKIPQLPNLPGLPEISTNSLNRNTVAANTASISPREAAKRLATLPVRAPFDPDLPDYDRTTWGEWHDLNRDCRNTRADILDKESMEKVQYPNGCFAGTGRWEDPWSGKVFTSAQDVDVDHHVPLANAHYSGAHAWDTSRKQDYYNDTKLPVALNAMSSADNRFKSAYGPERWKPALINRHCSYATGWIAVKSKYGLGITPPERAALADMLRTCRSSQ